VRYRLQTGSVAWLVHRVSGILLAAYLFYHFYGLQAGSPASPFVDVPLLALLIAHGLNGTRLILLDAGVPTGLQKPLFWALSAAGLLVFATGARGML
jgi:succinate dehydrogenase / fumarate reductase cytochrome b subunit